MGLGPFVYMFEQWKTPCLHRKRMKAFDNHPQFKFKKI